MKRRFITVTLIATALLSGCGNNQVTTPIESQVTEAPATKNSELTVSDNWWKNKLYKEPTAGMYFWIKEIENSLFMVVSGIPNGDLSMELCIGIISSLNKSIQKHNNLMGCQPYTKHRFR